MIQYSAENSLVRTLTQKAVRKRHKHFE